MNAAFFGLSPRQKLAEERLGQLAKNPPQVLVIEGGSAAEREAVALAYAAILNCEHGGCGECESCVQVREKVHLDLIFLDGSEESIKVDDVREIRQKVGEPPRGPGHRVVILTEAQGLTPQAANALLKCMEEPRPGNCFALLAPQRERLLPTLVSRAWTLTLAWPEPCGSRSPDDAAAATDGLAALERFWRTGCGLFSLSAAKTRLTRQAAQHILLALSKELADILAGRPASALADFLNNRLGLAGLRRLDLLLESAQEALIGQVNPSLTLEWLATRVSLWLR